MMRGETMQAMLLAAMLVAPAHALDSDASQPAQLQADEFELDLDAGTRIYRGAVTFQQGSMRLNCDELITRYDDADDLQHAECRGAPGQFRQRPQDGDSDLVGRAASITVDAVAGSIILQGEAQVELGAQRIRGAVIRYDLNGKKIRVQGGEERARVTVLPRE